MTKQAAILIVFTFSIVLCNNITAQSARQVTTRSSFSVQLDQNTIVRDSTGARLPYNTVAGLIASGAYTLSPIRDKDGKVTEYKLRPTKAEDAGKRQVQMSTPGTENVPKPKIGQAMPSFTLLSMDNKVISSDKLKGKIVVLNFWFTVCKPCIAEMPGISSLADSYKNNPDVVFIAPTWEKREAVEKFLRAHPFAYTTCPDADSPIDALKIQAYPTNLIIGRDGKILNSYAGGLPGIENVLRRDIEAAIKE
jgi:thiol-disulfide isomerase/thioredoxin